MILRAGQTRCSKCERFVYSVEHFLAVTPWKGTEALAGFRDGFYHAACFDELRWRDEYLALDRAQRHAELDAPPEELVVVARTERFALTLRPAGKRYTLLLLDRNRAFVFARPEEWPQFVAVVAAGEPATTGPVRLRRVGDAWEVSHRLLVPVRAEFAAADFVRIRQYLSGRGIDPTRTPVELGALCRKLGVQPTELTCPLERLTGTFAWPETPPTDPAEPVAISVQVEKWNTAPLSDAELKELRRFLRALGRK